MSEYVFSMIFSTAKAALLLRVRKSQFTRLIPPLRALDFFKTLPLYTLGKTEEAPIFESSSEDLAKEYLRSSIDASSSRL